MVMTDDQKLNYKAIDAVVNIWTREALSHRPDWGDDFFVGKMNAENTLMAGLSLEEMIEKMEEAGSGGTAELIAWILVMAATKGPATVLDYVKSYSWRCSSGWVVWPKVL